MEAAIKVDDKFSFSVLFFSIYKICGKNVVLTLVI